jgi:plastocyanin domain-containing protein
MSSDCFTSCRICCFGIRSELPDRSLHAIYLTLNEFDITILINEVLIDGPDKGGPFTGI